MTPIQGLMVMCSGFAGVLLGAIFFGGLWWTVRKVVVAPSPVLWMFCSFQLRMAIALLGFYFVASGGPAKLIACLAGFLIARVVALRLTRSEERAQVSLA
jgi:F1F0 ATPase subunit 2